LILPPDGTASIIAQKKQKKKHFPSGYIQTSNPPIRFSRVLLCTGRFRSAKRQPEAATRSGNRNGNQKRQKEDQLGA